MKYYLYILHSNSIDKYYVGISHDPETRLNYHNSFPKGWTRRGRPWELVFKKEFADKDCAQRWENRIKGLKSRRIISLILAEEFDWYK